MIGTYAELEHLLATVRSHYDGCTDSVVDFSSVTFHTTDTTMWLGLKDGTFARPDLHFRVNQTNPSDKIAVHAHKQFCKLVKIPHSFFVQNRPGMRETLVRTWLSGLTPGEPSSRRMVKVRECREMNMVRAILPEGHSGYPNHKALASLIRYGKDRGMILAFLEGEEADHPRMQVTVKFGDVIPWNGSEYRLGIELSFSDVSTESITAEALLLPEKGEDSYMFSFEHGSLLSLPYTSMPPSDMDRVISGLVPALEALRPNIVGILSFASGMEYLGVETSLEMVCDKVPSKSVRSKIRREFLKDGAEEEYSTACQFAAGIARLARSCEGKDRCCLERLAGSFLCMDLPSPDSAEAAKSEEASQ